jgi:hypothetical protein
MTQELQVDLAVVLVALQTHVVVVLPTKAELVVGRVVLQLLRQSH